VIAVLLVCVILGVVVSVVAGGGSGKNDKDPSSTLPQDDLEFSSTTLTQIKRRGVLRCGVPNQEGYAQLENGRWVGLEADLCRAVAAGIFGRNAFGNEEPVEFVNVEANERFAALNRQEIDLLLAITTHNMERNVYEPSTKKGYSFSKPYLVNGLIFAGDPEYLPCVDSSYDSGMDQGNSTDYCQNSKLCVLDSTTHEDIVKALEPQLLVGNLVTPTTLEQFYDFFLTGRCNLLAGEQFDVAKSVLVDKLQYQKPYDTGTHVHSKELISMVTRDDDVRWSDFVDWILQALLSAEELRLMRSSESIDPTSLDKTLVFGKEFETMFQDAVAVVGDYGQIYERHLEPIVPRIEANKLNLGSDPAMYATSFGETELSEIPSRSSRHSPKIEKIQNRGELICGINKTPIFADLNDNTWTGIDVSFCQAVAAALFDGKVAVSFKPLDPPERFKALDSGAVDILASVTTRTLERDVNEPTTGKGYTFSFPNFYDSIRFAGIPTYRNCAENLDWNSGSCRNLKVCVTDGTTQFEIMKGLFPADRLVVLESSTETAETFGTGRSCQVLAGGALQISTAIIEKYYSGLYDMGTDIFSREALALVTTEDDVIWSKFVNWVVISLVYAEEQSITRSTSLRMPRVDLFRPMVGDEFLRNAVGAVGSFQEIWERNADSEGLARDGRNRLNTVPLSPLLMTDLTWYLPIRG